MTHCPPTMPFGLILGFGAPPVDEPCGGNLRFSGHWILNNIFVTQTASSIPAFAFASFEGGH